jgi:hypothetical protein
MLSAVSGTTDDFLSAIWATTRLPSAVEAYPAPPGLYQAPVYAATIDL